MEVVPPPAPVTTSAQTATASPPAMAPAPIVTTPAPVAAPDAVQPKTSEGVYACWPFDMLAAALRLYRLFTPVRLSRLMIPAPRSRPTVTEPTLVAPIPATTPSQIATASPPEIALALIATAPSLAGAPDPVQPKTSEGVCVCMMVVFLGARQHSVLCFYLPCPRRDSQSLLSTLFTSDRHGSPRSGTGPGCHTPPTRGGTGSGFHRGTGFR